MVNQTNGGEQQIPAAQFVNQSQTAGGGGGGGGGGGASAPRWFLAQ